MTAELRIFPAQNEADFDQQEPSIAIPLHELLPVLTQAFRNNYAWLQDFLEDEVMITPDLYEVLRSFRCYRPSA